MSKFYIEFPSICSSLLYYRWRSVFQLYSSVPEIARIYIELCYSRPIVFRVYEGLEYIRELEHTLLYS
jgi:hypothetical protein